MTNGASNPVPANKERRRIEKLRNLSMMKTNSLEARLMRLLDIPLTVTLTDNTRSMVSVRKGSPAYVIRLHHMFLDADDSVLTFLAQYVSGRHSTRVTRALRAFIKAHEAKIGKSSRSVKPRRPKITVQGRCYHLQEAFDRLNREYFQNRIDCLITWGNRRRTSGRRTIRLGSYCRTRKIIRINPLLDRDSVPPYVVDHIIYHEMLHHWLGDRKKNGRWIFHDKIFKEMEKGFAHGARARLWLKRQLPRLLTTRTPTGLESP